MSNSRPRVLLFGMEGRFSASVLLALLEQPVELCALVVPAPTPLEKRAIALRRVEVPAPRRAPLSLLSSVPSLLQTAHKHSIPVWEVQQLQADEVHATLATYQPELLCVACYPRRIPRALFTLPSLAALNVHPSLLPANRGPVPLFWTFREGQALTGVTIHALEAQLDSGAIFAQSAVAVPDGISYAQLEARLAQRGGSLLAQTILNFAAGQAKARPQNEQRSSYHSFPEPKDFVVQAEQWRARHIYNFVQGVGAWGGPVHIYCGDEDFLTDSAISYSLEKEKPEEQTLYQDREDEAWVPCLDGWVKVRLLAF